MTCMRKYLKLTANVTAASPVYLSQLPNFNGHFSKTDQEPINFVFLLCSMALTISKFIANFSGLDNKIGLENSKLKSLPCKVKLLSISLIIRNKTN